MLNKILGIMSAVIILWVDLLALIPSVLEKEALMSLFYTAVLLLPLWMLAVFSGILSPNDKGNLPPD